MLSDSTLFGLVVLAETVLVLGIGPLVTRRHVKRDAVAIIEKEMVPRFTAAMEKLFEATEEKLEPEPYQVKASRAAVESREEFAAQEEAVLLSVMEKQPLAALGLDELRQRAPKIYKALVRQGPEAVLRAIEKLPIPGKQGGPPQVAYL